MYNSAKAGLDAQGSQWGQDYAAARASDNAMRDSALSGFQDFAQTGGFSPTSLAAIRSRSISPIRATYANAERNIELNRARGGTSAGANTLMGRMAREQGQAASDATTNAEAGIAQMVQQGKLAGNQGIANLYGTTPGQSSLFSNNVLQNMSQQLQLHGMENNRMQDILNTQLGLTHAPGKMDTALSQIGAATDIGNKIFRPGNTGINGGR